VKAPCKITETSTLDFPFAFFRVPDYDALLIRRSSSDGLAAGESGLMFCAAVETGSGNQVPNLG
jgi:hypothetical protein